MQSPNIHRGDCGTHLILAQAIIWFVPSSHVVNLSIFPDSKEGIKNIKGSKAVWFLLMHSLEVFTKWINTILQRTNIPSINDLQEGLSDGVVLCKLLEILSGKAAPRKYTPNIKSRHHKIQNLNILLFYSSYVASSPHHLLSSFYFPSFSLNEDFN
jgi:hypothetical protein